MYASQNAAANPATAGSLGLGRSAALKRVSRFTHRYPLNVPGKYYINDQCTDCDLCRECAPDNIRRDDRTGISFVFKQPATPGEIARVEEGVAGCPTEGVGNDGDQHDWGTTPIHDWNALFARHPDIHFDIRAPLLCEQPPKPARRSWWRLWEGA